MTNEQLKNDINFIMYCTKDEQKELLKLNNKVNEIIAKPITKENQNDKICRKLKDDINKKFRAYSIAWKIATDILYKL